MAGKLVISEQSNHPQSERIGRMLVMTAKESIVNYAERMATELGADGYEAALVRTADGSSPAIGLRKEGKLLGYVPTEVPDDCFIDLTLNEPAEFRYNQGPKLRVLRNDAVIVGELY